MSEQALDLKRSMAILRRHWIAVLIAVLIGLGGGAAYMVLRPPMYASSALVVLPISTRDIATQALVADSDAVLTTALRESGLQMPFLEFRNRVQAKSVTPNILSVSAKGKTPAEAERLANDAAGSYVSYVVKGRSGAGGKLSASILEPAISASRPSLAVRLVSTVGLGALLGFIVGGIGVLAWKGGDRRLRLRDAIADTVGVPVIGAVPVWHPKDAAGWARLFENYQPNAVHGWRLRNAIRYLGAFDAVSPPARRLARSEPCSVTVLSLSTDRRALALGPQLAVYAASQGIPTSLVIGPQQDANVTATLRAACGAGIRASQLRVTVDDYGDPARLMEAPFVVVVAVVDSRSPRRADNWRTDATILGVSSGATTDDQLARVAASAAADGRHVDAILVADPDRDDHTTGRVPQVARLTHGNNNKPTRLTKMTTEMR